MPEKIANTKDKSPLRLAYNFLNEFVLERLITSRIANKYKKL
jgi:hypothetical protein